MTNLIRQPVAITYPDDPLPLLFLEAGAPGEVNVSPGAVQNFVSGTIEYNIDDWAPKLDERGREVHLSQGGFFSFSFFDFGEKVNRWNLRLGNQKPFELRVKTSVSRAKIDLGGLPITDLEIETGVAESYYDFSVPQAGTMRRLEVKAGVGSLEMSNLVNAGFERMEIRSGVGKMVLRFGGESLKSDMRVRISGGVGKTDIIVPDHIPCHIETKPGLGAINSHGSIRQERSGVYQNDAYRTATGPRLDLEISGGIGAVDLDSR